MKNKKPWGCMEKLGLEFKFGLGLEVPCSTNVGQEYSVKSSFE